MFWSKFYHLNYVLNEFILIPELLAVLYYFNFNKKLEACMK